MSRLIECDVLVVGSGPVGAAFARLLAGAGRRVVVVDAGRQLSPRPGEHVRNAFHLQRDRRQAHAAAAALLSPVAQPAADTTPARLGETAFAAPRQPGHNVINPEQDPRRHLPGAAVTYAVGGMGVNWNAVTPRLDPELERWELVPPAAWERAYARAEALLHVHDDLYDGAARHEVLRAALARHLSGSGRRVISVPVAGRRRADRPELVHWTGPADVLGDALEHVRVLEQHVVERLETRSGRVVAAQVRSLDPWETLQIRAGTYVLAAGPILGAQVLWASGLGGDPEHGALGRYAYDHPLAYAQLALGRDLVAEIARRTGAGGAVPIPADDRGAYLCVPLTPSHRVHGLLLTDPFDGRQVEGRLDDRLIVNLYWYALPGEPRRDNRVRFSAVHRDVHGLPLPTFDLALDDDEKRRAREAVDDMRELGRAVGAFLPSAPPQLLSPGSSLHLMGTLRMGARDDGTSVTDARGRVWGLDNLYAGGLGLFPRATAANPTLTAVALAVHSAERILATS